MPYKYKLKAGHTSKDTFIPGVHISEDGTIVSETIIESPILEFVGDSEVATAQVATPVQAVAPQQVVDAVAPSAIPQTPQAVINETNKEQ